MGIYPHPQGSLSWQDQGPAQCFFLNRLRVRWRGDMVELEIGELLNLYFKRLGTMCISIWWGHSQKSCPDYNIDGLFPMVRWSTRSPLLPRVWATDRTLLMGISPKPLRAWPPDPRKESGSQCGTSEMSFQHGGHLIPALLPFITKEASSFYNKNWLYFALSRLTRNFPHTQCLT